MQDIAHSEVGEQVFSDTVSKPAYYQYRGGNQLG